MTKIVNGRIVSDSDAGESDANNSWGGGAMGSTSSSSGTIRLCGREFSSWSIGGGLAISLLFGGFRGLFFAITILGIAYCMGNSSSNTFNYSALSTSASGSGGSAPERGRSNIKGMKDLPKPAAKC